MESMVALEELIQQTQAQISLQNLQLQRHNSGESKLSSIMQASTEQTLEIATENLNKYTNIMDRLQSEDGEKLDEQYRLRIAAKRKHYFDTQDSRIKINTEHPYDVKLAALRILGEIPKEIELEDEDLFEIAVKSVSLTLPELDELMQTLDEIRKEFDTQIEHSKEKDIQQIAILNYLVPIIILHFKILRDNIQQSILDKNEEGNKAVKEGKKEEFQPLIFSKMPKYQDWWIRELWVGHQAYFALFKWKELISNQCQTLEQKKAWSIIYDRWVFVKKLLHDKGSLAFRYQFVFDSLLKKYAHLEEEMQESKLPSLEEVYLQFSQKEDICQNTDFHNLITPYFEYKVKSFEKETK